MYQKYATDALVLFSRESGDADRIIALYTRDFGLLWARAKAVRAETSKMRYALSHFSYARVSLIRGARGWHIAGCAAHTTAMNKPAANVSACARIAQLVMRLVAGEERNEYLFSILAEAHRALMRAEALHVAGIELLCVARMLYALGYLSADACGEVALTQAACGMEHIHQAAVERERLLLSINRALSETHL